MSESTPETVPAATSGDGLRPRSSLRELLALAERDPAFAELASGLTDRPEGGPAPEVHVSSGLLPFFVSALLEEPGGAEDTPVLIVTPDDRSAADLAAGLATYLAPRRVRHYPSRGTGYESQLTPPPHLIGLRIAALESLAGDGVDEPVSGVSSAAVVVASAVALTEAVPDSKLRPHGFAIHAGEEIDLADVAEMLVGAGYERVDQVEDRGQFAIRGGILDVFAATEDRAARIELFGDEVESIRWFSTFTQRSLGDAGLVELAPAAELDSEHREMAELLLEEAGEEGLGLADALPIDQFGPFLDLVPAGTRVIIAGSEEIGPSLQDHAADIEAAMHDDDARSLYVAVEDDLAARATLAIRTTSNSEEAGFSFRAALPVSAARNVAEGEAELEKHVRSGYTTIVCFEHAGEGERTSYGFDRLTPKMLGRGQLGSDPDPGLIFAEAPISDGFISPAMKLAVIPFRRLVHRRRGATPSPSRGPLATIGDLRVGDHVVHADHGIARFAGFDTRTLVGVTRDYLQLEYEGDDKVFVPAAQLDKITRYVGVGDADPKLSKLGGKRWEAIRSRARRAAREMAGELINLYAQRQTRTGYAFPPDGEWQLKLERSFPYRETADQIEAIDAVKADMESDRPMDRLICGDVGYGKTEVAIRAVSKAVSDGKQVMVLVPTTILAQQHLGTFRERLRDFPYEIEMVSRMRKPAEITAALDSFREGKLDVLIGTHRLLSRDVRAKDLGLLVIDEEQRFGVKQKELLRQLKLRVDVLSLSATPIPRTLQMSLAGLRDITTIETPPEGRRPVRTYVGPYDEELVRQAILRELSRDGQAFFLHNRIDTLDETTEQLRALVPKARFTSAHGQMDEGALEKTMLGFMRGDADVLVATTIIESGLDIPSANTLIVERSDMLGLAQAYQIRGRVGRSTARAYAYMLYPSEQTLTADAGARLATLSDHTELGSGFAIAMRDLELRGAGDLLGDEQSGHVAAIGFELYLEMLDEAVTAMREGRGDQPIEESQLRVDIDVDAYIPGEYVPFEAAKIDLHRRIAGARRSADLRRLAGELRDRFGPPPAPVENLIALQRARIELITEGAGTLEVKGGRLSISPLELDAARVGRIRERISAAMFESRTGVLSMRVESGKDAGEQRLAAAKALAEALAASRPVAEPDA